MELFSAITFEAQLAGVWTDISTDVLTSPAPRVSGMGIMGNSITDRVGDAGTLEFSLNNSESCSGGVLGYYTPFSANVRAGWEHGIRVRLSFTYDGYTRYKFSGIIDSDGIKVVPGLKGKRTVSVRCSNWMQRAADHELDLMSYQTNLRADQALQNVVDNMAFKPQSLSLGVGTNTFPTVFDINKGKGNKALGEIQKITMSGLDYFFASGDDLTGEKIVFMPDASWVAKAGAGLMMPAKNSDYTDSILEEGGDDILTEAGDRILLEHSVEASFNVSQQNNMTDLEVSYGKNLANRVTFTTYPRSVDPSAVVLYSLETPIEITAAETLEDIRGSYTDPNSGESQVSGISMVTPVATTDYQMFQNSDGTGTDRTADLVVVAEYGTSDVKYTLTNNNAATSYITKLQARGIGVYVYDTSEKVYDSDTSIATHGVKTLSIDLPYIAGPTELFVYADKSEGTMYSGGILTGKDEPEIAIDKITFMVNRTSKEMLAFMFVEPSDSIEIYETITEHGTSVYNRQWHVIGYDFEIISGKFVKWMPVLKIEGRR